MPIKSDKWIRRMCEEHGMIEPFESGQVRDGKISYGISSYGYDIRVSPEFKVFTNVHNSIVDPKNFDDRSFVDIVGPECIIPPNSFALARTEEYFRIPRDVLVICVGKSTLEPTWEGYLTLEISNTTPLPAKVYGGEGIAQLLFFEGDEEPEVAYADRKGKYMKQVGVTLPRM
jgi:dCTP deaminase